MWERGLSFKKDFPHIIFHFSFFIGGFKCEVQQIVFRGLKSGSSDADWA